MRTSSWESLAKLIKANLNKFYNPTAIRTSLQTSKPPNNSSIWVTQTSPNSLQAPDLWSAAIFSMELASGDSWPSRVSKWPLYGSSNRGSYQVYTLVSKRCNNEALFRATLLSHSLMKFLQETGRQIRKTNEDHNQIQFDTVYVNIMPIGINFNNKNEKEKNNFFPNGL